MTSLSNLRLISLQIAGASLLAFATLMPAAASAAPAPPSPPPTGTLTGSVVCDTGAEMRAADAVVAVEGMDVQAHTDINGQFILAGLPVARLLTVDALGGSVPSARYNVPVLAGQTLDIGALEIGACPQPVSTPPSQDSGPRDQGDNAN